MANVNDTNALWKNGTSIVDNATIGTIELNTTDDSIWFMSVAEYQSIRYVLYTFVIPVLCFIGSVSSSVGTAALFRALRKEASFYNIYLFSLFTFDTMTLLYGFWTGIPAIVATFDQKLGLYLEVKWLKYHNFFQGWLFNNSAFIILIISLQRLLALTKPHTVNNMLFTKYPFRFAMSIFVFNAVFFAPSLLIFDSKMSVDFASNTTVVVLYRKEAIVASETGLRLYAMATAFIYQFLVLTLAFVFNVGIIVMIKKRARKRIGVQALSAVAQHQNKMTYTTLSILSLFILLHIPSFIGVGFFVIGRDARFAFSYEQKFLFEKFWVLTYINCSLDVFIYVLLDSRQRKELFQRFRC